MKKTAAYFLAGAIGELLSLVSPVTAGVFTLTDGPNFTPPSAFTNNTIEVDTIVVGGLIHVQGGTTISSAEINSAIIDLSGDYSADAGDVFSIAFSFTADLNMRLRSRTPSLARGPTPVIRSASVTPACSCPASTDMKERSRPQSTSPSRLPERSRGAYN
jgi:hypothetical protein